MGKFRYQQGASATSPRRNEIWLVVDRDKKHDVKHQQFDNSVQGGTRVCIVVSNDIINTQSKDVEIVYTTTKHKTDIPTHFHVDSTPEPSIVLCEQVVTVPKKNLVRCYGSLSMKEKTELDRCLKISLDLYKTDVRNKEKQKSGKIPRRNEIWDIKDGKQCVIISNNTGNTYSPIVEIVYLTEEKAVTPTHFKTESNSESESLTGLCNRIMTIAKSDLVKRQRELTENEVARINRCIKISLAM